MEPIFFEALFYDARDGHIQGTLQWLARRDAGEFQPVHDGGFLVHAGDKVMRYSADLKMVRERDLIPPAEADEKRSYLPREWKLDVTPGGRVAFMQLHDGRENTDFWINADTLDELFSTKPQYPGAAIAGEDALATVHNWGEYPNASSEVMLWERGKDWRQISIRGKVGTFLADSLLLTYYFRKEFNVVDRKGSVIFGGPLKQADPSALTVKRNLAGTRFAISDTHRAIPIIQKHDFFDWNFEVKVGDVKQRKMVAEISLGTHDARQIDLALSPDGSQLAVLAESTLTLYRLP
jgi:hypothetical protein